MYTYRIKGMHCAACVEKIKSAFAPQVGVVDISLSPPFLKIQAKQTPKLDELNAIIRRAGDYQLESISTIYENLIPISDSKVEEAQGISAYYPLILISIYIVGIALLNNIHRQGIHWQGFMNQFMAGFFLVFSAFKLLDIKGFAEGYATYDLLAQIWYPYGFIYPFIELSLGVLYLTDCLPRTTQLLTILIMGFSSMGVINSLLKRQKLRCACLGTILKVPLSTVTLIEDLTMVILALLSIIS